MNKYLLHSFWFFSVLGIWAAVTNTNERGVDVVDGPEEYFRRRLIIDEDVRKRNVTMEVYLTSIDLLVVVRVDAVHKVVNSVTTTYVPGSVARNENDKKQTKPEKKKEKEQIVNNPHKITGNTLPPPETPEVKNSTFPTILLPPSEMAWNGLRFLMQSFYDWLTYGFGGPRHINVDKFAARSITRADLTWSADGSMDYMFNLDLEEMKKGIHRVNTITPMMIMTDTQHFDNRQLPRFASSDYFRSKPAEIKFHSHLQKKNEDSIMPSNTVDLDTPPQFATVGYYGMVSNKTVCRKRDFDKDRPERNLTTKDITSRDSLTVEKTDKSINTDNTTNYKSGPDTDYCLRNASRRSPENSWLGTRLWNKCMAIIGGWRKSSDVPVQTTRVKKSWMTKVVPVNIFKICTEASNKSDPETELCKIKPATLLADTSWFITRLWNSSVAAIRWLRSKETQENARNLITKDIVFREPFVEENPSKRNNESCPLKNWDIGKPVLVDKSNTSTPVGKETSLNSVNARNQTIYYDKCILDVEESAVAEILSNGTASQVCFKDYENISLGINDMAPSISHTRHDTRHTAPLKKAKNKGMAKTFINESEFCLISSHKTGPEIELCTKPWSKDVAAMPWLRSNETQEKDWILTNYYWTRFQTTMINWTGQVSYFVINFMALYLLLFYTIQNISKIIRLSRLKREIQEYELQEERKRLRQLEFEHEQAGLWSRLHCEILERGSEKELERRRRNIHLYELQRECCRMIATGSKNGCEE